MNTGQLDSKIAVVTGACRGIGLAIASRFLAEQATVITVDIHPRSERLQQLCDEYPDRLNHIIADVADEAAVAAMAAEVVARHDRLDVLINNAGIEFYQPVTTTSLQDWNRLMDINLGGVFLCSKHALPFLTKAKGCIVNIASELAIVAERNVAAYCASKGAILSLSRAMAVDHAPSVRVNCLCPGPVETELLSEVFSASGDPEGLRASFEKRILLGRLGQPEEVAAAALFLASAQSSFMSGASLILDGGWTAH